MSPYKEPVKLVFMFFSSIFFIIMIDMENFPIS